MISGFDGDQLIVGSVRGVRSFDVDAAGRLTGVFHRRVWGPGQNSASCVYHEPPFRRSLSSQASHRVAARGCSCGFYAYLDDKHGDVGGEVRGVIEGYGRVTVGSRGFRAEKAKILALVVPRMGISLYFQTFLVSLWMLFWTGTQLDSTNGSSLLLVTAFGLWIVGGAVSFSLMMFDWTKNDHPPVRFTSKYRRKLIREHYPDVQFFSTRRAMLRAFPVRGQLTELERQEAA